MSSPDPDAGDESYAAGDGSSNEILYQCTNCHSNKPDSSFARRQRGAQKGERTAVCITCAEKARTRRTQASKAAKASKADAKRNRSSGDEDSSEKDDDEDLGLEPITLTDFINTVVYELSPGPLQVRARVDVASEAGHGLKLRERADRVSQIVGNYMQLHWT